MISEKVDENKNVERDSMNDNQEFSMVDNKNNMLKRDINRVENDLRDQNGLSHKNQLEVSRLRESNFARENDISNAQGKISQMENEIKNNQFKIEELQVEIKRKEQDIDQTNSQFEDSRDKINKLMAAIHQLQGDNEYLEEINEQHANGQAQLSKQQEYEYYRGKDLQNALAEAENVHRIKENDNQSLNYENDHLKQSNSSLQGQGNTQQQEIEALTRHMNLLNSQNYELSVELEKFIEADEVVRRNLNRKEKVEQIRGRVDDVIKKSQQEVELRRSPERFRHN